MLEILKLILDEVKYNREINFATITNKDAVFSLETAIEVLEKIKKGE